MLRLSPIRSIHSMNEASILAWFDDVMDTWKGCEEGSHKLTLLNVDGTWLREGNKAGAGAGEVVLPASATTTRMMQDQHATPVPPSTSVDLVDYRYFTAR